MDTNMVGEITTHKNISHELCGKPVEIASASAIIAMTTKECMVVDEKGLIHGGFIFGLADHAAMLAVNHPNVVLASADVRFLLPIRPNEELIARAEVIEQKDKKHLVRVSVTKNNEKVFTGTFSCTVLEKHVLEK